MISPSAMICMFWASGEDMEDDGVDLEMIYQNHDFGRSGL